MVDTIITNSQEETILAGLKVGNLLKKGNIVALTGELGAGKTEMIKGICEHFKVEDMVSSPTFTIINQYEGYLNDESFSIYHIDLYRIKKTDELTEIGFRDCLSDENSIKLIEWAEKAGEYLTNADIKIIITPDLEDENKREIIVEY